MVDPVTMAVVTEGLKNPKALGEGIQSASQGVSEIITSTGSGTATVVTSVGNGVQGVVGEVHTGKTNVTRAQGNADAERITAQGNADAERITAQGNAHAAHIQSLTELAVAMKDLPLEIQQQLIENAKPQAIQPQSQNVGLTPLGMSVAATLGANVTQKIINSHNTSRAIAQSILEHSNHSPTSYVTDGQEMGKVQALQQDQSLTIR
jgi:hypothetical protein